MKHLWLYICIWLVFIVYIITLPYDNTDDSLNRERSGLIIYTDHLTGCEYLGSFFGGPTPRLNSNGNHIGCKQ